MACQNGTLYLLVQGAVISCMIIQKLIEMFNTSFQKALALTLLMLRIDADNADYTVATNDFAVTTHLFN